MGSLKYNNAKTRKRKIDKEKLKQSIEEKPDSYLHKLAKLFDCSEQAIFYALKKMKITYKKTFTYSEKSEVKRSDFLFTLLNISNDNIVYIDESGIDQYYQREKGYSLRGIKIEDTKRGRKFQRTNIAAGLYNGKIIAPLCYTQRTNHEIFEYWFKDVLIPAIPKNSTVILDNASFHRKNKLSEICANAEISLIFQPPYSPDFNSIEKTRANLKRFLRSYMSHYTSVDDAIYDYLNLIVS